MLYLPITSTDLSSLKFFKQPKAAGHHWGGGRSYKGGKTSCSHHTYINQKFTSSALAPKVSGCSSGFIQTNQPTLHKITMKRIDYPLLPPWWPSFLLL